MQRRHHCMNCGFLVCAACSKQCAVLRHIHPIDLQRVCRLCSGRLLQEQEENLGVYDDVAAVVVHPRSVDLLLLRLTRKGFVVLLLRWSRAG
ncbi:unnamed protein product [Merluccius merluccius]